MSLPPELAKLAPLCTLKTTLLFNTPLQTLITDSSLSQMSQSLTPTNLRKSLSQMSQSPNNLKRVAKIVNAPLYARHKIARPSVIIDV